MNKANYSGVSRFCNRTDDRELERKVMRGTKETDIPLGDGKAQVAVTRGFKEWCSTYGGGLTVEATVTVNLTCGQSSKEIEDAAECAGDMAEGLAVGNMNDMRKFEDAYKQATDPRTSMPKKSQSQFTQKTPVEPVYEPPRRSEKLRRG